MSEGSARIKMVVGLGNPGIDYANTRHNVGAATVELLAQIHGAKLKRHHSRTRVAQIRLGVLPGGAPGPQIQLAIAETYMNVSGGPLARLAAFAKVQPAEILVLHDDLDIPAHQLKLKNGGGDGGHNGLKSLTSHLKTKDYARLRIGIGRPPGRQNPADYVLAKIPAKDREEWETTYRIAAEVVEDTALRGVTAAQQDLHAAQREVRK